jgi:hypothetical protein
MIFLYGDSVLCEVRAVANETGDGLGIWPVDDLKIKPGTVFFARHKLKLKKGSTYKQNQA